MNQIYFLPAQSFARPARGKEGKTRERYLCRLRTVNVNYATADSPRRLQLVDVDQNVAIRAHVYTRLERTLSVLSRIAALYSRVSTREKGDNHVSAAGVGVGGSDLDLASVYTHLQHTMEEINYVSFRARWI